MKSHFEMTPKECYELWNELKYQWIKSETVKVTLTRMIQFMHEHRDELAPTDTETT